MYCNCLCVRNKEKEKGSPCLMFTSHTKREIRVFNVVDIVQWRQRNIQMYKKRDARAELLFCQSKPIAFNWPVSLTSPSSLLKLPFYPYTGVHLR